MRQLLPSPVDNVDDAAGLYRRDDRGPVGSRPWLLVNMVTSLDGAVTVSGRSGGLSNPNDKAIFFALRSIADVILVGAGTVRAEDYGPPRLAADLREQRSARGQSELPRIAVVSGRLALDPTARLFDDAPVRPIILTSALSDGDQRATLAAVADVHDAGDAVVDAERALRVLGDLGARVVVCEGGPTLNGTLLAADVVDELCLTVAPLLASGASPRAVEGIPLDPPVGVVLDRVLEDDGFLFLRYRRPR